MWPKSELLIAGPTREIPIGQNEPILPAQVTNQNARFASSSRLRIQLNNLGTLSEDDGDCNENGKKLIGLDWQNNFARASCFLYIVHFFFFPELFPGRGFELGTTENQTSGQDGT